MPDPYQPPSSGGYPPVPGQPNKPIPTTAVKSPKKAAEKKAK